jgi:hypothetical protein
MDRTSRRLRVALATGLVMLSLTAFAGVASAAPGPTHNGFTGACNMVMSWPDVRVGNGVGVQPGGGMENAMTRNLNGNGNAGMTRATINSGLPTGPDC